MNPSKRAKRDTVDNLYRQCQLGADCPPDVRNKVEATTLADKLLQAFGSIIFLGGLGIGSGSGSGTVTAGSAIPEVVPEITAPAPEPVRPLRPTNPRNTTRPFSVPLDRIGVPGSGGRPVTIDASSSSIVPLTDPIPDTVITLGDPTVGVTTNIAVDVNPIELETITATTNRPAIINVTPIEPPPVRVVYSENPAFTPLDTLYTTRVEPNVNVFVDPTSLGEHIGLEEIELETLGGPETFEIEESGPSTSTPIERLQRVYARARQFYQRHVEQVPTRNLDFLGQPSRAILFGYDNPAFTDDITLEFQQDLQEVAAAPDEAFRDIRTLSRPTFTLTNEGTIRLSRLGTRGTMQTRSGRVVGQTAHFYYDVSSIPEAGEIEMQDLVTPGVPHTIVNPQAESSFIDALAESAVFNETDLIDPYNESFDNAQLILEAQPETDDWIAHPTFIPTEYTTPLIADIGDGLFYSAPTNISENTHISFPSTPIMPGVTIDIYSIDYDIHPSLLKRKRKRIDYV